MAIKVEFEGEKKLQALFKKMSGKGMETVIATSLFMTANEVLNKSKIIVPVDKGFLKDSGRVEPPKAYASGVEVKITYGGASAKYAAAVHEHPKAKHKPGKSYHFLKIPVDLARATFVNDIKRRVLVYLKLGG